MDKNKKKGFTLVELIVVLAILAILAAMLVPALTGYIDKANEKKILATARQYYVAAQTVVSEAYANDIEIECIEIQKNNTNDVFNIRKIDIKDNKTTSIDYLSEFEKLAEIKNSTTHIVIYVANEKIFSMLVYDDGKGAAFSNDKWTID